MKKEEQSKTVNNWHTLSTSKVIKSLQTSQKKGLLESKIQPLQEKYGKNKITEQKQQSVIVLFLSQFHQPLVYVLLIAVIITALIEEWVDSIVILGVVLVNAIIGFFQEYKAKKAIRALSKNIIHHAIVIRNGKKHKLMPVNS